MFKLLLLGFLGYKGYEFFTRGRRLRDYELSVVGATLDKKKTNLFNLAFDLDIGVYNPSQIKAPVQRYTGNIYFKDKRIANFDTNFGNKMILKPRATTAVKIATSIPTTALASEIVNVVRNYMNNGKFNLTESFLLRSEITIGGTIFTYDDEFFLKDYI